MMQNTITSWDFTFLNDPSSGKVMCLWGPNANGLYFSDVGRLDPDNDTYIWHCMLMTNLESES